MDLINLFESTVENKASDLHITVGVPPMMRINGNLVTFGEQNLVPEGISDMIKQFLS